MSWRKNRDQGPGLGSPTDENKVGFLQLRKSTNITKLKISQKIKKIRRLRRPTRNHPHKGTITLGSLYGPPRKTHAKLEKTPTRAK